MAKKTTSKASAKRYTKPKLRQRLKEEITDGDKGGASGQWSARKAQMLAAAYKKEGGGYSKPKAQTQKHLDAWTAQEWTTDDGSKARAGGKTTRYLPKKAWEALSPAEKRKTKVKKESASQSGQQFVANTPKAKQARKKAATKTKAKKATHKKKAVSKKKASGAQPRRTKKVTKSSAAGKKRSARSTRRGALGK